MWLQVVFIWNIETSGEDPYNQNYTFDCSKNSSFAQILKRIQWQILRSL